MVVTSGETVAAKAAPKIDLRFQSLDALRGISALIVALFHFRTTGYISNLPLIRNGWLFVDFFFVLSGFVIAHAYARKIGEGRVSPARFMILRAGRIYPMHLLMLGLMIAMELLLWCGPFSGMTHRHPFEDGREAVAIVSNVLLLHSFGVHNHLTWNGPSWSIAAEMWTYALFAVTFGVLGLRARLPFLILGLISLFILVMFSPHQLNTTYQFGFLRAVFGFALGTMVQYFYERGFRFGGTAAEVAVVALSVAFVCLVSGGAATFLGPFIFAITVWIFSAEKGQLSRLLQTAPLALLGTVSYSLYMIHAFVQGRLAEIVELSNGVFGAYVVKGGTRPDFAIETIVAPPLVADMITIIGLLIVIGLSVLSYRWVEYPCREWTRARFARPRLVRT